MNQTDYLLTSVWVFTAVFPCRHSQSLVIRKNKRRKHWCPSFDPPPVSALFILFSSCTLIKLSIKGVYGCISCLPSLQSPCALTSPPELIQVPLLLWLILPSFPELLRPGALFLEISVTNLVHLHHSPWHHWIFTIITQDKHFLLFLFYNNKHSL